MSVNLTGIKVLLAEDTPALRALYQRGLQHFGAVVTAAASGEEALERLQADPPDVLVSDIAMPDGDGFFLIQAVRSRGDLRHLRAAAISAYGSAEWTQRALQAGFDAFEPKPLSVGELSALVARLVNPSRVHHGVLTDASGCADRDAVL